MSLVYCCGHELAENDEINPIIPADYKWWYKSSSMVCSCVLSVASARVYIQLFVVDGVVHGLIPPLHPLLPERQEELDLVRHCDAVPVALHDYRFATLIVYIMGFLLKKFFTCIYVDLLRNSIWFYSKKAMVNFNHLCM